MTTRSVATFVVKSVLESPFSSCEIVLSPTTPFLVPFNLEMRGTEAERLHGVVTGFTMTRLFLGCFDFPVVFRVTWL